MASPAIGGGRPEAASPARDLPIPVAGVTERRHVSVLFADLVGFTTLSERRDSEEVRELLTRYFDACQTVVGRYGGVVEKFGDGGVGDAGREGGRRRARRARRARDC
jgi:class 3 adenylate cyclase